MPERFERYNIIMAAPLPCKINNEDKKIGNIKIYFLKPRTKYLINC